MDARARCLATAAVLIPILAVGMTRTVSAQEERPVATAQEPGFDPYQEEQSGQGLLFSAVPEGKRLVLREITCEVTVSFGSASEAIAEVGFSPNGRGGPSLRLPITVTAPIPVVGFNDPILLFADAGARPFIAGGVRLGDASISSLDCTLSGYFVPRP